MNKILNGVNIRSLADCPTHDSFFNIFFTKWLNGLSKKARLRN